MAKKLRKSEQIIMDRIEGYPDEICEAVEAALMVYRYESGGGFLHCVISDGNVEAIPCEIPTHCPWNGKPYTKATQERYRRCVDSLWALTIEGREFACHVANGLDPWDLISDYERNGDEFEAMALVS